MNLKTGALVLGDLQNDFLHREGAYGRAGLTNPQIAAIPEPAAPPQAVAPGPAKPPEKKKGPGFFSRIGHFFRRLFGAE